MRDNLPVFGWIALGGRCRTCRLPISPRYPIVEAAVGTSLSLIAIGELYRISLPGGSWHWQGSPLWAPLVATETSLVLLYHVTGVTFAWAMGLIRWDGHRLPSKLMSVAIVVCCVAILVYPPLMIVSWRVGERAIPAASEQGAGGSVYLDALVGVVIALVAAALLGRSLARSLCPAADLKRDPLGHSTRRLVDLIAILTMPTLLVGWQASLAVTVTASLFATAIYRVARSPAVAAHQSVDSLGCFA